MKIGLCGTMSVGKTTLVNALKELDQFKIIILQLNVQNT
jgi:GTPase SAR1 family protein